MNIKSLMVFAFVGSLAACAETQVTAISKNEFILSTSAAPACGRTGAMKVAARMAAVETLRRGYQRFMIVGAGSANNVRAISTGPTYAYTSGTATAYGNTIRGNSMTTYGGNGVMFFGSNDADLRVLMLGPRDRGFGQALDAKSQLGPKWKELVDKGIHTCTD